MSRYATLPTYFVDSTPVRCVYAECDFELVRDAEWYAFPPEHRPKDKRRHAGRGLCTQCHKREQRLNRLDAYAPLTKPIISRHVTPQFRAQDHVPATPFPQDVGELPCQDESVDSRWWFSYNDEDTELAKFICSSGSGCPAKDLCLKGAQERKEYWGVWGGEVLRKGKIVNFQRVDAKDAMSGEKFNRNPRKSRAKVKEVA